MDGWSSIAGQLREKHYMTFCLCVTFLEHQKELEDVVF
jgi:hypothetical protein